MSHTAVAVNRPDDPIGSAFLGYRGLSIAAFGPITL
jgi:hypothetical protein